MILKRDMTAAESNYLQCSVMTFISGVLIAIVSTWKVFGVITAVIGVGFLVGFFILKHGEDKKTIAEATKTVRKDQPKDGYKVKYTTRKERKAAEAKKEAEDKKKSMPANNKKESIKKAKEKQGAHNEE